MRIGLGGGCHWCTEAVFQTLRGVTDVAQGFIAARPPHDSFSEAVVVTFDPVALPLSVLLDVHLRTHASTAQHSMRAKYRSAVYVVGAVQGDMVRDVLARLQDGFAAPLVTQVLTLDRFRPSPPHFQNYYQTDAERPFCTTYIDPKLARIRRDFGRYVVGA